MPPSSPGQLFNYPGLLIVPGTRRSGAEAGPAPVNDWLFHHAPLGTAGRRRDRGSRRAAGSFRSVVASAFFYLFFFFVFYHYCHCNHHHLTQLERKMFSNILEAADLKCGAEFLGVVSESWTSFESQNQNQSIRKNFITCCDRKLSLTWPTWIQTGIDFCEKIKVQD